MESGTSSQSFTEKSSDSGILDLLGGMFHPVVFLLCVHVITHMQTKACAVQLASYPGSRKGGDEN